MALPERTNAMGSQENDQHTQQRTMALPLRDRQKRWTTSNASKQRGRVRCLYLKAQMQWVHWTMTHTANEEGNHERTKVRLWKQRTPLPRMKRNRETNFSIFFFPTMPFKMPSIRFFFLISIRPIRIWHITSVKLVSNFGVEISFYNYIRPQSVIIKDLRNL